MRSPAAHRQAHNPKERANEAGMVSALEAAGTALPVLVLAPAQNLPAPCHHCCVDQPARHVLHLAPHCLLEHPWVTRRRALSHSRSRLTPEVEVSSSSHALALLLASLQARHDRCVSWAQRLGSPEVVGSLDGSASCQERTGKAEVALGPARSDMHARNRVGDGESMLSQLQPRSTPVAPQRLILPTCFQRSRVLLHGFLELSFSKQRVPLGLDVCTHRACASHLLCSSPSSLLPPSSSPPGCFLPRRPLVHRAKSVKSPAPNSRSSYRSDPPYSLANGKKLRL
eukprot:758541-Hanusia_phi.AAC.5